MVEQVPVRQGIYAEAAGGGVLLGNKCISCGQIFFPKSQFCLNCFQENMEPVNLHREGILYSYAISHMPSTHFDAPYAAGYVDLPDGVRVFAQLEVVEGKPFRIGMRVEVVIGKLWQEGDKDVVGYRFRPI